MKYLVALAGFLFSYTLSIGQERSLPKLSPLTQLYFLKAKGLPGRQVPNYVYRTDGENRVFISALIKVKPGFSQTALDELGVHIGTKAGNIWTTHVPLDKVEVFTRLGGIEYIQLDEPAMPNLDTARVLTKVDSVQSGFGLQMQYSGHGVVAGIIDVGFDYTHPDFFDTTGAGYRVRRVWEQKKAGTPPSGFSYGNEMTDSNTVWASRTDAYQTHGTHVAGIVSGGGFENHVSGDNRRYRGMAYGSDLVFVGITPDKGQWINTGSADIIDGIHYVFNYAASQSKPAVANLSWGCVVGPHDGSSLFSQACDNLTGPGKIFVCSAGNNGDNKLHLKKTFTGGADTVVRTFVAVPQTPIGKTTWIDIWGDTSKSFCINMGLFNGNSVLDSTGFICLDNKTHSLYLVGSNNDTCYLNIVTSSSEFNLKPRIFIEVISKTTRPIGLAVRGASGTVNMWEGYVHQTTGYYGSFTRNGGLWATEGDVNMTISDYSSTRSAVAVGAYTSKNLYKSVSGGNVSYTSYATKGNIAPFSSLGPTADGRVKPEITAPGLVIGSALSSYDSSFLVGGSSYSSVETIFTHPADARSYPYGMLMGTSMSSPAVSGIVALMLQANPQLTPQMVTDALKQTAIQDNFTGVIAAPGSTLWGAGKVNAYAAVKRSEQLLSIRNVNHGSLYCGLYPNPSTGYINFTYEGKKRETLLIHIYDLPGHLVASRVWTVQSGYNSQSFDLSLLSKGFYMAKIVSPSGSSMLKVIIE
ncbi:MAG TPA: S8/S53 family peptidase [Flavipsychrobacter sp.]|nr:S8/S53 family peptidase [Flavipsychrobacter sp.]